MVWHGGGAGRGLIEQTAAERSGDRRDARETNAIWAGLYDMPDIRDGERRAGCLLEGLVAAIPDAVIDTDGEFRVIGWDTGRRASRPQWRRSCAI
jgi:hypothetical protein